MQPYWKKLQWAALLLYLIVGIGPLLAEKSVHNNDIEFLIVIPSFNNNRIDSSGKNWIEKNLESVFSQTNVKWTLCYVNDCSKDNTGEAAERYAQQRGMLHKCRFINNPVNRGALANLYDVISTCPEHNIVVLLDGDDELFDNEVLNSVEREYRHHKAWITYGSYIKSPPGDRGIGARIPSKVMKNRLFRQSKFVTFHLRTFFAKLFQSIKKEDLMYQGKFFGGGWDLIILFPMLEMASQGHVRYIKRILYKWNSVNPLSDCRVHSNEQGDANVWVRSQLPYAPLKKLFPLEKRSKKTLQAGIIETIDENYFAMCDSFPFLCECTL
jgi:glycosyltransferase involved in cell wall biosynthesis